MSDHAHDHDHPAHLAHHFETPEQQMESGKLGMWVFLATEILMFGGLFCAYSVYRGNHPEVFLFAHQYLDTFWGAVNTAVLLASSFTMAWGVRAAQLGQTKLLVALLCATLAGGAGFMVIKTVEYQGKYSHDIWVGGLNGFYQTDGMIANDERNEEALKYLEKKHKEKYGKSDYDHGDKAHAKDDAHHDDHAKPAPPAVEPAPSVAEVSLIARPAPAAAGLIPSLTQNTVAIPEGGEAFTTGVGALQIQHGGSHYPEFDELAPQDANSTHIFFQIYFMMTGLHGIHVLIGLGLIGWITYRAGGPLVKALVGPAASISLGLYLVFLGTQIGFPVWLWVSVGVCVVAALASGGLNFAALANFDGPTFGPEYYTPVDLVGLYWHLVDLIWIFLFPLLYLIH
ncbi:MAG: hypothetical protein AAF911_08050 [Planctomycetota bacterium]